MATAPVAATGGGSELLDMGTVQMMRAAGSLRYRHFFLDRDACQLLRLEEGSRSIDCKRLCRLVLGAQWGYFLSCPDAELPPESLCASLVLLVGEEGKTASLDLIYSSQEQLTYWMDSLASVVDSAVLPSPEARSAWLAGEILPDVAELRAEDVLPESPAFLKGADDEDDELAAAGRAASMPAGEPRHKRRLCRKYENSACPLSRVECRFAHGTGDPEYDPHFILDRDDDAQLLQASTLRYAVLLATSESYPSHLELRNVLLRAHRFFSSPVELLSLLASCFDSTKPDPDNLFAMDAEDADAGAFACPAAASAAEAAPAAPAPAPAPAPAATVVADVVVDVDGEGKTAELMPSPSKISAASVAIASSSALATSVHSRRLLLLSMIKALVTAPTAFDALHSDAGAVEELLRHICSSLWAGEGDTVPIVAKNVMTAFQRNVLHGRSLCGVDKYHALRAVVEGRQLGELPPEMPRMDLRNFSVQKLAEQLTYVEFNTFFCSITDWEMLGRGWNSSKDKLNSAPHVIAMIELFDRRSAWVGSQVFQEGNLPMDRAEIVIHLIAVALECLKLQNFHTVFSLVAGLDAPYISRQKSMWALIPEKFTAQFARLRRIVEPTKNYSTYRRMLSNAASSKPMLPYLGVVMKDLYAVDAQPDKIGRLISFKKWRELCTTVSNYLTCKWTPYDIKPDEMVQSLIAQGMQRTRTAAELFAAAKRAQESDHEAFLRSLFKAGFM
eukprot:PLAT6647.4.p1 GENE.PLAT6647.4~~PLAT6647.4.p1  ORF type:complete len:730 (+),score=224.04 PLAT6647.4:42-2231(+)